MLHAPRRVPCCRPPARQGLRGAQGRRGIAGRQPPSWQPGGVRAEQEEFQELHSRVRAWASPRSVKGWHWRLRPAPPRHSRPACCIPLPSSHSLLLLARTGQQKQSACCLSLYLAAHLPLSPPRSFKLGPSTQLTWDQAVTALGSQGLSPALSSAGLPCGWSAQLRLKGSGAGQLAVFSAAKSCAK